MISNLQKFVIGAVGALCLGLLKLIGANFYVTAEPEIRLVAYLTYTAYVILGMFVARYFTETREDVAKTQQQCFIMGLLAPSILLAIVSDAGSRNHKGETDPAKVQVLGYNSSPLDLLTGPRAFAADDRTGPTPALFLTDRSDAGQQAIRFVNAADMLPSKTDTIKDGILLALGRPNQNEGFSYVLGNTPDKAKALEYAGALRDILGKSGEKAPDINVVSVEDKNYIITVGRTSTRVEALRVKDSVLKSAAKALGGTPTAAQRKTAIGVLRGDVFDLTSLVKE